MNLKSERELAMDTVKLNPNQDQKKSLRKFLEYQGYTSKEIEGIIFNELFFTLMSICSPQKRSTTC